MAPITLGPLWAELEVWAPAGYQTPTANGFPFVSVTRAIWKPMDISTGPAGESARAFTPIARSAMAVRTRSTRVMALLERWCGGRITAHALAKLAELAAMAGFGSFGRGDAV